MSSSLFTTRAGAVLSLAALGTKELVGMALRGVLGPEQLWTAFWGARKCLEALARGDVASDVVAEARVGGCDACPSCVRTTSPLAGVQGMYCGKPLDGDGPGTGTCGCLVGLTVGGRVQPACKSLVRSETCGQRRWAT